ncbi:MAG: penicillin-binding protein 2 [Acidobacteriota bacterium]
MSSSSTQRAELAARVAGLSNLLRVALVVVAIGYWMVQVARGEHYRALAEDNRLREVSIEASRGLLRDRADRALTENVPSYGLWVDGTRIKDGASTLAFVESVLDGPPDELSERAAAADRSPRPVRLASGLSLEELSRIAVRQLEHPELEVRAEHRRLYRYAHQTAHLLGYLGEVDSAQIARSGSSYRGGDQVGKRGLERQYEASLRGTRGEQVVVVDSHGQTVNELGREPALPGVDLVTTLDLDLQQEAARQLEGKVGAIVAMDPRTGGILAMVSAPSFDPNLFARGLSRDDWKALTHDPRKPLQNRAIQNTYPPGSVFKIVMAAAGLELNQLDPAERVFCGGWSRIYGHRYRCHNAAGHGWVDLEGALRESCNVYFHQLGQRLGIDIIADFSHRFGFGARTGIDLPGEKAGLVPSSAWSLEARGTRWYPGETISVATGQGPILVTPLQVATMLSAVATGGALPTPHLVGGPSPGGLPDIEPRHLERIRDALWSVVEHPRGTGRAADLAELEIAGKTGTAQVVRQETWTSNDELAAEHRDHAWFASFAPVDDPQLVVVVFVEHGGGGSKAAAPLARALYAKYFGIASSPLGG